VRIARKLLPVLRDLLAAGRVAYSMSLTARPITLAELEAKIAAFFALVARRWPAISILLGVDKSSATGPWHVHAMVFVPAGFDPERLVEAWRRLWPRKDGDAKWLRPMKGAQWTRVLGDRDEELVRVLVHALRGPRRAGLTGDVVPRMANRVWAFGALAGPWARLLPWARSDVATVAAPLQESHLGPGKVSAVPVALPRRWRRGHSCCWKGEKLVDDDHRVARRHQKFHDGCRQSASRALQRALKKYRNVKGRDLFLRWVKVLEDEHHLLRRNALRVAADRVWAGDAFPERYRIRAAHFTRCSCGRRVAIKSTARTCGRDACRARNRRRRLARIEVDMTAVNDDVPPAGFVPPSTRTTAVKPAPSLIGGEYRVGTLIVSVQDFDEAREVCAEIERWAKQREAVGA